jgi:hypothetical protein
VRETEPLPHPKGVVPQSPTGFVIGEADGVQHLRDAAGGQAHGALCDGEHLPAGAPGVLGGGVEEDPDVDAGVGQVPESAAQDVGGAVVGRDESDETRRVVDLPAPLGPRKPVMRPGRAVKVTSSTAVKVP